MFLDQSVGVVVVNALEIFRVTALSSGRLSTLESSLLAEVSMSETISASGSGFSERNRKVTWPRWLWAPVSLIAFEQGQRVVTFAMTVVTRSCDSPSEVALKRAV